jgi:uncharacterized delta-60 repeat protein
MKHLHLLVGCALLRIALVAQTVLGQNAPGRLDTNFDAGGLASGIVQTLAVDLNARIIAGGSFTSVSTNYSSLIRLTTNGGLDAAFSAAVTGTVDAVSVDASNRILAVGFFFNVNGFSVDGFARFDTNGAPEIPTFTPTFTPDAVAALPDGTTLLGGFFTDPTRRLVHLTPALADDGSFFTNSPDSVVEGFLVQPDGKVIVFGWFQYFGTVPARRVLRLNSDMTLDTNFNALVDNSIVRCGALQSDGKIVIGGSFSSVGGEVQGRIARLHPNGSLDVTFRPMIPLSINALAIDGTQQIYVGGSFLSVNGSPRERLARLHPDGSLDTGFDPGLGPNSTINTIALETNGNVIIGGTFTNYDGTARVRIARVFGGPSIPAAPAITRQPTNQTVLAGASPSLVVRANGGPRLFYQWRFNGVELAGETRATLTLTNALPDRSGTYSVVVSNELGVIESDLVSVTVLTFPPGFTVQPTSLTRFVGQNARHFRRDRGTSSSPALVP